MGAGRVMAVPATILALIALSCGTDAPVKPATPQAEAQETTPASLVTAPPGCKAKGPTVSITTTNVHYNQECVGAPAQTAFTIEFQNGRCSGCAKAISGHNVSIYTSTVDREQVFRGKIIPTRTSIAYHVPPLEAGIYSFQCIVHGVMNGVLVVE